MSRLRRGSIFLRTAIDLVPPGGPPPADERSKVAVTRAARGSDFRGALYEQF